MKKRILAIFLTVVLTLTVLPVPGASAAAITPVEAANALNSYGLFRGTDKGYELDRQPTRQEALVMLIRLMGKETEATSTLWSHPFSDVDSWASAYVGYAYQNGITMGRGDGTFGGAAFAASGDYTVFILRALGYSDADGDFVWNDPWSLAASVGLTDSSFDRYAVFDRGGIAVLSYSALGIRMKGAGQTLLEYLKSIGAVPTDEKLTGAQVSQKAAPAVFLIMAENNSSYSQGSGFFIDGSGVAVTNYHVIDGMTAAYALMTSGERFEITNVIYADKSRDVAIIRVTRTSGNGVTLNAFPYLVMGDSSALQSGETVYALGNPMGLQNTFSNGIVSNPSQLVDGQLYIQNTTPISPGSSGGALLNERAQVIGVTTSSIETGDGSTQNLNFAVPINTVKNIDRSVPGTPFGEWAASVGYVGVDFSVSPQYRALALTVGDKFKMNISFGVAGYPGDFTVRVDSSNELVVSGYWEDDWKNETNLDLTTEALSVGTATLTISIRSEEGVVLGMTTVSVTVNPAVGSVGDPECVMYTDYPMVPDFGSFAGVYPQMTEFGYFVYSLQSIYNSYGYQYESGYEYLLGLFGFIRIEEGIDYDGDPYIVYYSAVDDVTVKTGTYSVSGYATPDTYYIALYYSWEFHSADAVAMDKPSA